MLPVFHGPPRSTPFKAMLQKKAIQKVTLHNFIRKGFTAIHIFDGRCWFHNATPVLACPYIGIIERVDINSHAHGMLRKFSRTRYLPIAETGGVIIAHGTLVICLVVIYQTDMLDGVFLTIEFAEDFNKI